MNRKAIFLLAVLLIPGMGPAFAGGTQEQAGAEAAKLQTTAPGTYPIVEEKLELRLLTLQTPFIVDWATNRFTQFMEELTNVHILWETVPEDSIKEKINLVLASGDYPDVFFGCGGSMGITPALETIYGSEEQVFLPLNELIDKHMPNFKKVLRENPTIRGMITAPDGNIYSLPHFEECYHCSKSQKVWVYQPWLEKLGLEMPETTEEFYQMLVAFRDGDPNGNGKRDEIPYAGSIIGWRNTVDMFLLNAFLYCDVNARLDVDPDRYVGYFLEGGRIDTAVNKAAYREGLRYLYKLYREGLIFEGSFTQDSSQLTQLVENPEAPLVGVVTGGWRGMFSTVDGERFRSYRPLAPLQGPRGVRETPVYLQTPATGNFVITKDCPYPEVAARWVDYLYSGEGTLMLRQGFEGEAWRWAESGEKGLDGNPAIWYQLRPWNDKDPQNDTWIRIGVYSETSKFRLGQGVKQDVDYYGAEGIEKLLYDATFTLYEPHAHPERALPPLRFLAEEQSKFATIKTEYAKHVRQSLIKFIVGDLDIEKDWDDYLANLSKLGLEKILAINQQAYDRQYK